MESSADGLYRLRIAPPEEYRNVFSHFYVSRNDSASAIEKTLLPSFEVLLIFSFKAGVQLKTNGQTTIDLDKCVVLGPVKQAFRYTLFPKAEILVVHFKDDAFSRFFGADRPEGAVPLHPNCLIGGNCFSDLWESLNMAANPDQQIEQLLLFSHPYLKPQTEFMKELGQLNTDDPETIGQLSQKLGQTKRSVQLKHQKYLGYSSKEMQRYRRFLKTIERIQEKLNRLEPIDWFELIEQCGFYDQSQLIHDFNYYLNISPGKYLKFQQDICLPGAG